MPSITVQVNKYIIHSMYDCTMGACMLIAIATFDMPPHKGVQYRASLFHSFNKGVYKFFYHYITPSGCTCTCM